jgi:hypothetical protein
MVPPAACPAAYIPGFGGKNQPYQGGG